MLPYALCLNSFVSFELKNNVLRTGACFANGNFIFLPVTASVAVGMGLAGGPAGVSCCKPAGCWKWGRLVVLEAGLPLACDLAGLGWEQRGFAAAVCSAQWAAVPVCPILCPSWVLDPLQLVLTAEQRVGVSGTALVGQLLCYREDTRWHLKVLCAPLASGASLLRGCGPRSCC